MNADIWIDRLYEDSSLTDNLQDRDAQRLLSWAESQLMECDSDGAAQQLMESIRLLDHYVGQGRPFDELFLALKANTPDLHPSTPTQPLYSADPNLLEQYPIVASIPDEQTDITESSSSTNGDANGTGTDPSSSNPIIPTITTV